MDIRKNLNNPDILPYDYVELFCQWYVENSPLATFTVLKELAKSFNFNSEIESISNGSYDPFNFTYTIQIKFKDFKKYIKEPWIFYLSLANNNGPVQNGSFLQTIQINNNAETLAIFLQDITGASVLQGETIKLILTGKRFKNAG